eukprot:CAMPEP_0171805754 /NCGR_PEP_ID=MMETSP0991-20121206/74911_1 /TAXON_ID=483369 /ORGANISM="non described non described, Strain CCMP2098" /LENGTH=202 /DNA_ID=CAMNT_0012418411 /DNA_START=451 /DNA_END=1057 /DNA_ORIENTATION=-
MGTDSLLLARTCRKRLGEALEMEMTGLSTQQHESNRGGGGSGASRSEHKLSQPTLSPGCAILPSSGVLLRGGSVGSGVPVLEARGAADENAAGLGALRVPVSFPHHVARDVDAAYLSISTEEMDNEDEFNFYGDAGGGATAAAAVMPGGGRTGPSGLAMNSSEGGGSHLRSGSHRKPKPVSWYSSRLSEVEAANSRFSEFFH